MSTVNEVQTEEGLSTPSAVINGMVAGDEMDVKNVLPADDIAALAGGVSPQPDELDAVRVLAGEQGQPAPQAQPAAPAPTAPGQGTLGQPQGTPAATPEGTEGQPDAVPAGEGVEGDGTAPRPNKISFNKHERLLEEQAAASQAEMAELRQVKADMERLESLAAGNPNLTVAELTSQQQAAAQPAQAPAADPRVDQALAVAQQNAQYLAMRDVAEYARSADGRELGPDETQSLLDHAAYRGIPATPENLRVVYDSIASQDRVAAAEHAGYQRGRQEMAELEARRTGSPAPLNSAGPTIGAPSASPRPPTTGDAVMQIAKSGML